MSPRDFQSAPADRRLWSLTEAMCDGSIAPDQLETLESLLRESEEARLFYSAYMDVHGRLLWRFRSGAETELHAAGGQTDAAADSTIGGRDSTFPDSDALEPGVTEIFQSPASRSNYIPYYSQSQSPGIFYVGGPVFSYMVASVFMCFLLLGFWAYKLPSDRGSSIASNENSRGLTAFGEDSPHDRPAPVFVGRITGMAGVKWSDDPDYLPPIGVNVRLGRQYKLKSGLMEITYKTGAKVILEGPCAYKVDSRTGGYLQQGKLTARVEKNDELGIRSKELEDKSDIHHSTFINHYLFSVTTPTAVVTDLGTEFGVEVDRDGNTASRVFEGTVRVEVVNGGSKQDVVLHEGDAARVFSDKPAALKRLATDEAAGEMPSFVRRLAPPPTPKPIDLLDIVAGGNGLGNKRECGIDPSTGMEDSMFQIEYRENSRRFIPVAWNEIIDGVFMPDCRNGSVQIDSIGHKFGGFPETDGRQFGSIWSRAADVGQVREKITRSWVYSMVNGAQFMPERRGLLVFYANTGITFDLGALRKIHSNIWPARFQAVAGLADGEHSNPEDFGQVDLWVLVDGQLKFKREKLRVSDGVVKLDIELATSDHFLTLAVSDGGNGIGLDCVVFGDPVLEAASTENRKEGQLSK
ncbi:MAG: hypothetical protein GX594_11660 [Pirellulaceae bacterium]|nr:hypothetical protein [Pirellulaceae bacterium]